MDVTGDSYQAVPGVIGDPAVVAMVGLDVMGEDGGGYSVGLCGQVHGVGYSQ